MRDIIVGIVLLFVAGIYWIQASTIPVTGFGGPVSAQELPKRLAIALAVCSAMLILQAVMTRRNRKAAPSGEVPAAEAGNWRRHARAAGILAIGIAYALLVEFVGYVVGIFLVIVAASLYMGDRMSPKLLGIAVAGSVGFWLIFVELLNVPLPSGILRHAVSVLTQ